MTNAEWLSLSEAADLLGVHPSTLRTWADQQKLPSHRTPGGHRRFRRSDLEDWARSQRQGPMPGPVRVVQATLGRTRLEVSAGNLVTQTWYARLSESARKQHREIGSQLLTALQRYLSEPAERSDILISARELGESYYRIGGSSGMSLRESVRAFIYFRDFLFDTVLEIMDDAQTQSYENWQELYQLSSRFTNEVLVALVGAGERDLKMHSARNEP